MIIYFITILYIVQTILYSISEIFIKYKIKKCNYINNEYNNKIF